MGRRRTYKRRNYPGRRNSRRYPRRRKSTGFGISFGTIISALSLYYLLKNRN